MDLSIVIPVFNESRKIDTDIKAAATFLHNNFMAGEIIIVDDGSTDHTAKIAKSVEVPPGIKLNVVRYHQHRGKGFAIRAGVAETSGQFVMFADSGCCVPYTAAIQGMKMIQSGTCDIAHGSRKLVQSKIRKEQKLFRRFTSRLFRWFVHKFLALPPTLTDTQCGFKIYQGDIARQLYSRCNIDGFMFDIEIIIRAQKKGYKIREFPIEWTSDPDSRLSPIWNLIPILFDLFEIKKTLA